MAFNRKIELVVQKSDSPVGVVVSDLDVVFEVHKSRTLSANTAKFVVYNASEDNRKNLLVQGANVVFSAGHEDETVPTVYIGNIQTAITRKTGRDYTTELQCISLVSSFSTLKTLMVSVTYGANTPVLHIVNQLATLSGLALAGSIEALQIPLPNGFVFAGTFFGALREIKALLESHRVGLYMENNELVVYYLQGTGVFSTVSLSYTSGLLKINEITEADTEGRRIQFECLLNGKIRPNGLIIVVDHSFLNGTYIVDKIEFKGSNFNDDYICIGEAEL